LGRCRLRRAARRRRGRAARLWRDRPRAAPEPRIRSAAGVAPASRSRARLAARRRGRDAADPADRNRRRARCFLRPLDRRLRSPHRHPRGAACRTTKHCTVS
jgi:hypothetical protein